MELPSSFWNSLQMVFGVALFLIGILFVWKFFQAAFLGKVAYWAGLEKFGFIFIPVTWFVTPLFCILPSDPKNSLIKNYLSLWVHLVWGPAFFVLSLMFMTSGADLLHLPASSTLNTVLTLNCKNVQPCIVYKPPFTYRFPFLYQALRTVIIDLTGAKIPQSPDQQYNPYEKRGDVDTSKYSEFGPAIFYGNGKEDTQPRKK